MRGKEKPGKTNCGKIVEVRVNLGETGWGECCPYAFLFCSI